MSSSQIKNDDELIIYESYIYSNNTAGNTFLYTKKNVNAYEKQLLHVT